MSIFTEIKAIKSRSIVWFPQFVPVEIENLYEYIKSEVDAPMTTLMEESDKAASDLSQEFYKWQAFFTKKVSPRIEKHTTTIAETLSRATT